MPLEETSTGPRAQRHCWLVCGERLAIERWHRWTATSDSNSPVPRQPGSPKDPVRYSAVFAMILRLDVTQ